MTDYTKSTNFTSKDSLSTGNPLKIIKGAEFDTEFNAISTAVATKADIASPALTGTPTAPTASVGTNTTQLATTALVFAAMQALYPVGTIYSNISVSTNPATLFGFGTWTAIAGRVVVGLDGSDASFDTVGETGGSKDAIVVSHTHTATVTDPGHTHSIPTTGNITAGGPNAMEDGPLNGGSYTVPSNTTGISVSNSTEGSSATNANLQPYVVAYVWKRTA
jgi:hypothetical protein